MADAVGDRLILGRDPRCEDEHAPEPIDDRWDRREEVDDIGRRPSKAPRRDLGGEERDPDADGHRDDNGDERGVQRAVDEGESPELVLVRDPFAGRDEREALGLERRPCFVDGRVRDQGQDRENGQAGDEGQAAEGAVGPYVAGATMSHGSPPLGRSGAMGSAIRLEVLADLDLVDLVKSLLCERRRKRRVAGVLRESLAVGQDVGQESDDRLALRCVALVLVDDDPGR